MYPEAHATKCDKEGEIATIFEYKIMYISFLNYGNYGTMIRRNKVMEWN